MLIIDVRRAANNFVKLMILTDLRNGFEFIRQRCRAAFMTVVIGVVINSRMFITWL